MLRITKITDYGVVIMTHLAQHREEPTLTAKDLAQATEIPAPMVSKILKTLCRRELLHSHRGVKGGYSLARDPAELNLADIIFALEGPIAMTECSDHGHAGDCRIESSCRVRVNWQRINNVVRTALARITLAEMADTACAGGSPCAQRAFMMPGPKETLSV
jgi:FeS assembly SUF system regulator